MKRNVCSWDINFGMEVPLDGNFRSKGFWDLILDKFKAKLEKWKHLLELFAHLPFSGFKAPIKVIDDMEKIARNHSYIWYKGNRLQSQ